MGLIAGGVSVSAPSQILLQPFSPEFGKLSGYYYGSGVTSTTINHVMNEDSLHASPIILAQRTSIDRLGVYISTAVVASNIRLGLYASTSKTDLTPGALLADSGNISSATTGAKTYTVALTLDAGVYWIVVMTSAPAVKCYGWDASTTPFSLAIDGLDGSSLCGYSTNQAFGVLPNPYPAGPTPESIDLYGMVRAV